ncbi:MAG: replication initiation protein [Gammaproteobacteria bacterium]|nr:replication initiation protein [Gammaproteobacteria bacterium]MBV9471124.1 replication initiation protein [Abditibacteriaceae bacterium]
MPNLIVTKSNHLVEANYKLSLNEQRLVLTAISQIDGRKSIHKDNEFTITANEFSEIFKIPVKQAYEALDDATSRLYERDVKTHNNLSNTTERFRWVDYVKYWHQEAKVTLSFSYRIIPYLTLLHKQFTSYELKQISKMRSAYSIRFYELLLQFIKTGERHITLEKLRDLLEIKKQYTRFFDFKKYILIPSMKDINETTDIRVEWDVIKKGSRISGLMFVFEKTG